MLCVGKQKFVYTSTIHARMHICTCCYWLYINRKISKKRNCENAMFFSLYIYLLVANEKRGYTLSLQSHGDIKKTVKSVSGTSNPHIRNIVQLSISRPFNYTKIALRHMFIDIFIGRIEERQDDGTTS